MRRDLGDFQTPTALVARVLATLEPIGTRWTRVLEPTCGQGRFIAGLLATMNPCLLKFTPVAAEVRRAEAVGEKVVPELVTPTTTVAPVLLRAHPLACVLPVVPPMKVRALLFRVVEEALPEKAICCPPVRALSSVGEKVQPQ